jgi:hypothetical protein
MYHTHESVIGQKSIFKIDSLSHCNDRYRLLFAGIGSYIPFTKMEKAGVTVFPQKDSDVRYNRRSFSLMYIPYQGGKILRMRVFIYVSNKYNCQVMKWQALDAAYNKPIEREVGTTVDLKLTGTYSRT